MGSSTEGHVSHILSERMSSRPMGWSKVGLSKMADIRVYSIPYEQIKKIANFKAQIVGL